MPEQNLDGATSRRESTNTQDDEHNQGDEALKKNIQDSYAKFGLTTTVQFRYGRGLFSPRIIELGTPWKKRSILTKPIWDKLNDLASQIMKFLPSLSGKGCTQKELALIHRLIDGYRANVVGKSLKALAIELHRERDHTKDESNLAEFEFYSTLLVIRHCDEQEVWQSYDPYV